MISKPKSLVSIQRCVYARLNFRNFPRLFSRNLIVKDYTNHAMYAAGFSRLQRSAREQLSVTDFITQFDEMQQIDKFAGLEREVTARMQDGTRVHELLDVQTAQPTPQFDLESVLEEPMSPEVTKFLDLLDKLVALADPHYHSVREMRMRGYAPNGCLLHGIIDGLDVTDQGLVVTETKTTRNKTLSSYQVRLAYHQALSYNWLLRKFLESGTVHSLGKMFTHPNDGAVNSELDLIFRTYPREIKEAEKAIEYLRNVGVASYVKLQYLKLSGAGYTEETLEMDYDETILADVFRSRIDLFEGRRNVIVGSLRDADSRILLPSKQL